MRIILAVVIAVGVLSGTSASAEEPVGSGKVYVGPEGESVAVIPLTAKGPNDSKQFVLYVQGTDSEFDGKAMLHTMTEQSRGFDYVTQYKGEEFHTVIVRDAYGSKKYEMWVPGRAKTIVVNFDEKRTKALDAEDVYEKHTKQKKDGTLGRLAAFNRKEREATGVEGLAEQVKALNDTCGTKVTATIDWKSVTDDAIKTYSISSYCATPLNALQRLCDTPGAKKIIQAKVKTLACQFGPEMKLDVKAGAVSWTTAVDAANQEEFATKYFEKNL